MKMKSLARKIALQFFLVIAAIFFVLAIILLIMTSHFARSQNERELQWALQQIELATINHGFDLNLELTEAKIPPYINYVVFNADNPEQIFSTDDPFLHALPVTNGKAKEWYEKNYFSDGDLFIVYTSQALKTHYGTLVIQVSMSLERDDSPQYKIPIFVKIFLILLLPLLAVSYLAAYIIAKRTLRPVVQMTKIASKISAYNLDTKLAISENHNELDSLAKTFNDLFERIRHDFAELQKANRAKSQFLSNMSHEIRTPINAILGLDEMILRESGEQNIREYAADIQSSGKSLVSIINDILDFSKIEAGKMEIICAPYDFALSISDLVNMISPRAKSKSLEFFVCVNPELPRFLNGDEMRLKQCILNILTNAVKYTPSGSVQLNADFERAGADEILLKISVKDTGIGIKECDLQKLFSPFERIEENRNRTIEGTGLGLSIVKSLLGAMNSRLEVQSVYGEGSVFSFCVRQKVCAEEKIGDWKTKHSETHRYTESFQAPNASVLVVDDTVLNLTVFKGLLKSTRIQIDTAESAADALEMAKCKKYDVLFIDHRMPITDGVEMLHLLRADESSANQHTVCVALTANAISGSRDFYLSEGFDDYLSKPVEPPELESMLRKYLPSEKMVYKGDAAFAENQSAQTRSLETGAQELWQKIFAQDINGALKNCGSADVFLEATRNFYTEIAEKSADIDEFARAHNWNDFTVKIHSVKSSARLIGALSLSEQAAFLEQCGDGAKAGDEEAMRKIEENMSDFLHCYRAYSDRLAPLFAPEKNGAAEAKCAIDQKMLDDALCALKEVAEVFDFDCADSIIADLERFSLPKEFAPTFLRIKKAVHAADQAALLSLLG